MVKYFKSSEDLVLKFPKLYLDTLEIIVFSDALVNHTSQLGYIILLMDATSHCAFIQFSSHKSLLLTRSSMTRGTLAFSYSFVHSFTLNQSLHQMLLLIIQIHKLTHSKILLYAITSNRYTTEIRLMVGIVLIKREYKAVNSFRKIGSNLALNDLMSRNHMEQYFIALDTLNYIYLMPRKKKKDKKKESKEFRNLIISFFIKLVLTTNILFS